MLPTSRRSSFMIFIKLQMFKTHVRSNKTTLILNEINIRGVPKTHFFQKCI